MPKKILIAYGTRYGSTSEIAERFSEWLTEDGHDCTVVDLRNKVQRTSIADIEEYDAVILGSGIRAGQRVKEAANFLITHADALSEPKRKTAFFVSSLEAATPSSYEKAKQKYLEAPLNKAGVTPDLYDAFGGIYDLSEDTRQGRFARSILGGAIGRNKEILIEMKKGERNDLRDWDKIREFARLFSAQLLE